jgi:nicotinamide-nucleotide amidase
MPMLPTDRDLEALALRVGRALLVRSWRAATAESCTGGWIAKALTDVPGSSQWFDGGVVSYSNAAKQRLLGVSSELLAAHGAVSEPVVRAMAEGARTRSGVEVAVAVSGVAGPDGGTPEKPVGTVWLAWALPSGTIAERQEIGGGREAVRRASVAYALERLLALVWSDEAPARDAGGR